MTDRPPLRPAARMGGRGLIEHPVRLVLGMVVGGTYGWWLASQSLTGTQYAVIALATVALMVLG